MNRNRKSAIAIGNFDGCHRGHQKIFRELRRLGSSEGFRTLAITFDPNPRSYFNIQQKLIFTSEQKNEVLLKEAGVEPVTEDFGEVVGLTPDEFVDRFLCEKYDVGHIVVGANFRFGYNRLGTAGFLKEAGKARGFKVSILEAMHHRNERISSSRIRTLLQHGEVDRAAKMLGRNYYIDGIVESGEKIGRQIGFPTMNIKTDNTILPGGVFETEVEFEGKNYKSVTNIGVRPTFEGSRFTVETHIPDFSKDMYDRTVRLHICRKLRNEKTFNSPEELVEQIKKDIACLQS